MRLQEVLDAQIIMEEMVEKIYRRFAGRYGYWEEASRLWKTMAEEENRHVAALYWCKRLVVDLGIKTAPCVGCDEWRDFPSLSRPECDDKVISDDMEAVRVASEIADNPDLPEENAIYITSRLENLEMNRLTDTLLSLPENEIYQDVIDRVAGDRRSHARHMHALVKLLPEAC